MRIRIIGFSTEGRSELLPVPRGLLRAEITLTPIIQRVSFVFEQGANPVPTNQGDQRFEVSRLFIIEGFDNRPRSSRDIGKFVFVCGEELTFADPTVWEKWTSE